MGGVGVLVCGCGVCVYGVGGCVCGCVCVCVSFKFLNTTTYNNKDDDDKLAFIHAQWYAAPYKSATDHFSSAEISSVHQITPHDTNLMCTYVGYVQGRRVCREQYYEIIYNQHSRDDPLTAPFDKLCNFFACQDTLPWYTGPPLRGHNWMRLAHRP